MELARNEGITKRPLTTLSWVRCHETLSTVHARYSRLTEIRISHIPVALDIQKVKYGFDPSPQGVMFFAMAIHVHASDPEITGTQSEIHIL